MEDLSRCVEVPPNVIIRNATPNDLLQVMHINRLCLPENYTFSFFEALYRDAPRAFFVAEHNGKIVGYVMCRIERIFSKIDKFKLKKAGHIVSIAVLPDYRRMHIGSALMKCATEALKNEYDCYEVYLEVRVSNEPAITMYEKLGFYKVERQEHYYIDGEDAYVMARRL
ncbi:MAG: ribosomal protein S18-alanine N-acetyltransferase [Nitrososphaerota archaeon]